MTEHDPQELLARLAAGELEPRLPPDVRAILLGALERVPPPELIRRIEQAQPEVGERVLDMANTEYYPGAFAVRSLPQAVVRLGASHFRQTTAVLALTGHLRDALPHVPPEFWKLAVCRALACGSLEELLRGQDTCEAFVVGLLLEIGRPVLATFAGGDARHSCAFDPAQLDACLSDERTRYGLDHRQVGEALLLGWGCPPGFAALLRPLPQNNPASGPLLARISDMAGIFSSLLYQDYSDLAGFYSRGYELLGLDGDTAGDVLIMALDDLFQVAENLISDADFRQGLLDLLKKSRRFVAQLSARLSAQAARTGSHGPPPQALRHGESGTLPSLETIRDHTLVSSRQAMEAVAHEIRNPLTALGGFAKRLVDCLDPASSEYNYAKAIYEEGLRLEGVISDMRDIGPQL